MIKSNYLILSGLYFDFNNDLTEIENVKELFEKQNILDLYGFDKMKTIIKEKFSKYKNINFVYLPKNIESLESGVFSECKIQSLDLSQYMNLKIIGFFAFENNQIKQLKLPKNINNIYDFAFFKNQIEILDLSNYIKLKSINNLAFDDNSIKQLKLPKNIEILGNFAFSRNQIEILDLSNCIKLKNIEKHAFEENPLNEIKILGDIELKYDLDDHNIWNRFVKYYNKNNKKSGDYKLENDEWQWYPL